MNSVPAAPSQTGTDTLTRVIAGLICLILLDAAQLLFLYPDRTDTLWAWKLQPEATAMLLGSVYAGGAYFFARIVFGAPWIRVATGFPSVIVFVWMAGIATLLHLDRFIKDGVAVRGVGGAVRGHAVPRAVAGPAQPPPLRGAERPAAAAAARARARRRRRRPAGASASCS